MAIPAPDQFLPDPHDVVRVEGPEAETFLQGQISQHVPSLADDAWAWAFVLAPDGKLVAPVRLHRTGTQSFDLIVDVGFGEQVATRLSRFKLRTDCEITVDASSTSASDAAHDHDHGRIEAGIPKLGVDIAPGDLAASTPLVDAAVDFTKGCFVGQELVARMDSRSGTAPTRLVRLRAAGDSPPASGARLSVDDVEVGAITSVAPGADGWVALAMVSRKLDGSSADVDGQSVTVEELG